MDQPFDVAPADTLGSYYIADTLNNRIAFVDGITKIITTYAGLPESDDDTHAGGSGGPASAAALYNPQGVVTNLQFDAFICDTLNHKIKVIRHSNNFIYDIAGTGTSGFGGDGGPALLAELNAPGAIYVDIDDNVFIADTGNDRIRKVVSITGVITTIAGNGNPGYVCAYVYRF